jgi:LPXTG-site transpeptidase (sortase) family protein
MKLPKLGRMLPWLLLAVAILVPLGAAIASATITVVDDSGNIAGFYTALVLAGGDRPIIAYYDFDDEDLKLAYCDTTVCDNPTITSIDSVGPQGSYTSMVLRGGNPVISYYDFNNGDLKIAFCNDPMCSTSVIQTLDGPDHVGQHTSLVLDSSGFPVISYYDNTNEDLKLVHCGNASCTAGNSIVTVDNGVNTGMFTSLKLDSSGFPVIAYHNFLGQAVMVAHCVDVNCTGAATISQVDANNNKGFNGISMQLGSNGFPMIAYADPVFGDFLFAHCVDVNCAGAATINIIDTGDVGEYPSMQLLAGKPVISYYDANNEALKLAKCANANCSSSTNVTIDSNGTAGVDSSLQLGSEYISYFGGNDLRLYTNITTAPAAVPPDDPDVLPESGFAPGGVVLAARTAEYVDTTLTLSLPTLGKQLDILGVPQSGGSWDVSWLGNNAGWLEGTAFPGMPGNSVITAHVWGADNQPGPFSDLHNLAYGDQFSLNAWGLTYTYEVRSNALYSAKALSLLESDEYDWVTLLTCHGFDEASGEYQFRRAVRAVLVSIY